MSVEPHAPAKGTPPLLDKLARRIRADGPITVAGYMEACLADPEFGYYRRRDPFGVQGDFITAPEVSQMFGELLGLWCVAAWRGMGSPVPVQLIELGPGRGTLMADALRAARLVPEMLAAVRLHLVETSPALQARQAETLRDCGVKPTWHKALGDVPEAPAILLANEFLDALPVRQLVRKGDAWRERCVGLDDGGHLAFMLSPEPVDASVLPASMHEAASEGAIAEIRPAVPAFARELSLRATANPLAALVIDYGHAESGVGDTLQAVRAHDFADPLAAPGEADLTAHVDFEALGAAARAQGLDALGPITQRALLLGLGLRQRCDTLLAANPAQAETIAEGATRLVSAEEMGELFLAMALTSPGLPTPPPFGATTSEDASPA